jgi:hypothetical protein
MEVVIEGGSPIVHGLLFPLGLQDVVDLFFVGAGEYLFARTAAFVAGGA